MLKVIYCVDIHANTWFATTSDVHEVRGLCSPWEKMRPLKSWVMLLIAILTGSLHDDDSDQY